MNFSTQIGYAQFSAEKVIINNVKSIDQKTAIIIE